MLTYLTYGVCGFGLILSGMPILGACVLAGGGFWAASEMTIDDAE